MRLIGYVIENQHGEVLWEDNEYGEYWDKTGGTIFDNKTSAELTLSYYRKRCDFVVRIAEVFIKGEGDQ